MSELKALKGQLADMGNDLFNLEVSTILKPNISASKMPDVRRALADIAKKYHLELLEEGLDLEVGPDCRHGSYQGFIRLGELAGARIQQLGGEAKRKELDDEERASVIMMERIRSKSAQLALLLKGAQQRGVADWDNNLDASASASAASLGCQAKELVLVRKIWELGVEEIAMQTVVQLDGDVVTRIQPKYANAEFASLHQVHHQGLQVSMGMWRELVTILQYFLDKGMSLLVPGAK